APPVASSKRGSQPSYRARRRATQIAAGRASAPLDLLLPRTRVGWARTAYLPRSALSPVSPDGNRPARELRKQLVEAGEGDVCPLGALDDGLALCGQTRDREAHRDPVISHSIDAGAAKRGWAADDEAVRQLSDVSAHRGEAFGHLGDSIRLLDAQLSRAANRRHTL